MLRFLLLALALGCSDAMAVAQRGPPLRTKGTPLSSQRSSRTRAAVPLRRADVVFVRDEEPLITMGGARFDRIEDDLDGLRMLTEDVDAQTSPDGLPYDLYALGDEGIYR